ncbi:hypothetical protein CMO93_02630 [Candidatus Woesearchaeota archaeon]|nr:hypothetical protein [Candidatus Woesearchaeota archaeon]|tara:strand:+ start:12049 stop:14286 length:2238 start_codon:yes stop_codon:yes gene_type:complete
MNAKKLVLGLFSFLLLLLLINFVNAQEDFTASTLPSVELCPCSNQGYAVVVQNTGSIANSYTLLAGGDAAGWVTFNPKSFVLAPGQSGSFFVYVDSICNIEGHSGLEIFITTNNGLTKVVKQTLKISECYDYSLDHGKIVDDVKESVDYSQHEGSYSLCSDEQKSIPILITNNENFENSFNLFLDAPGWAKLNAGSASLGAKSSGIFLIDFDTTDVNGDFNLKLAAISKLGKVQRKKSIGVSVDECYALEVELEKEQDMVCGGENKRYAVIVKNSGTLRQDVELEVEGADWAGFGNKILETKDENDVELSESNNESKIVDNEPESMFNGNTAFELNSDEEKTAELNLNPPDELSGNFIIKVHAVPDNKAELRSSDAINIDVVDKLTCYQSNINAKSSVTNIYKEDLFFAKVTNDGIKKITYAVSLEGPSWVSVSPQTLELNPGQIGNLNLNINPLEDTDPGNYGVKINLEGEGALYSENINIKLRKETELEKNLKSAVKENKYYIYLLIFIIILLVIFRKRIIKVKNRVTDRYKKYKIRQERKRNLRLARQERQEEKKKQRELEEKKKQELRKKELEKEKIKKSKFWEKYKNWIYSFAGIIAVLAYIGYSNKLFNIKYIHIYAWNLVYGYLYYILLGLGVVFALFLFFLFYNYFSKRKKTKEKREIKKSEKKPMEKILGSKIMFFMGIVLILAGLSSVLIYYNLFDEIKDFFVLYSYYFVLGIIILITIIVALKLSKRLQKFLKE